jgi:hypothetical protein
MGEFWAATSPAGPARLKKELQMKKIERQEKYSLEQVGVEQLKREYRRGSARPEIFLVPRALYSCPEELADSV